jgi:hypothetical protein
MKWNSPGIGMAKSARSYRDTASFGKRQEYVAIGKLLRLRFDVYMTLVDDQGIDCVIRREVVKNKPDYLDIQIKARSGDSLPTNAGRFVPMFIPNPRPNLFFIFYSEQADTYWVFPSLDLVREANRRKSGASVGRYSIVLTNYSKAQNRVIPRPRFRPWEGRFDLLEGRLRMKARSARGLTASEKPRKRLRQSAM